MDHFSFNIKIEQGATFRCIISCKDADGNVVPLTGWSSAIVRPLAASQSTVAPALSTQRRAMSRSAVRSLIRMMSSKWTSGESWIPFAF